jgi:leucine-rich repeat protein SHOC2
VLDLTANKLQLLPLGFFEMTHLQVLRLGLNRLAGQLGQLAQLAQLQELDISNNKLAEVPASATCLTQ